MQTTNKITILGVGISQITLENALKTIEKRLNNDHTTKVYFIATPNPEMLVLASQDRQFRHVLNSADLAIPDGIGLVWATKLLGIKELRNPGIMERVAGVDLMLELCRMAAVKDYSIGLLGAGEGVAEKTAEVLKRKFPGLKIAFSISDLSNLRNQGDLEIRSCDLLFVAFGAPKQEEFINKLQISNIKYQIKVAMGVGGAFDLISGKLKRAPKVWQSLGLEWLWRLIQEPMRLGRIINATIVFPYLVLKERILSKLQR